MNLQELKKSLPIVKKEEFKKVFSYLREDEDRFIAFVTTKSKKGKLEITITATPLKIQILHKEIKKNNLGGNEGFYIEELEDDAAIKFLKKYYQEISTAIKWLEEI